MPLTPKLFETVISGKSKEGLHSLLQSFKAALLQDTTISTSSKNSLLQIMQKLSQPFEEPVAGVVLGKQIETLQNTQESISTRLPILQALKQAGILPIQATLSQPILPTAQATLQNTAGELVGKLIQATPNEKVIIMEQVKNWVSAQATLNSTQKKQILSVLKNSDPNAQITPINNALIKAFSEQSQQAAFLKDENGITPKEHLLSLLGKGSGSETIFTKLQPTLPTVQATLQNTAGELVGKLVQATPNEKVIIMEQVKNWVSAQATLNSTQKEQILSVLKNSDPDTQITPINNALIKAFSEQSQHAAFLKDENGITPKEHLLSLLGKGGGSESFSQNLQQILKISESSTNPIISQQMIQSEETVLQQLDGKAFEHAMKEVLKIARI